MKNLWYWFMIYVLNVDKDNVEEYTQLFLGALGIIMLSIAFYYIFIIFGP